MNHLHNHADVLLRCGAQVVLGVAFFLQLEDHFPNCRTLPADAAELMPQGVGLAPQGVLDERLALETEGTEGRGQRRLCHCDARMTRASLRLAQESLIPESQGSIRMDVLSGDMTPPPTPPPHQARVHEQISVFPPQLLF